MTKIKICGINDAAGFDAVVAAGADYLGFVFFPPSPRFVTPAQAATLTRRHAGGPQRVGLFVNPTPTDIAAALEVLELDVLQIYGDAAAFTYPGLQLWQALGVSTRAELPAEAAVDGLVIEAKAPLGASRPGGNAVTLDWSLLAGWKAPLPWLLGGGLTTENVAMAIAQSGAPGVDVSSGVESAPGVKLPDKIFSFVAAVRNALPRAR